MSSASDPFLDFRARGGVADLSSRVKLVLTGSDRVRYLNGQVTSNVQKLAAGQTQPACITTAKGRLCAEVTITATGSALFVDADASLLESLPPRLERYIIADDVTLQECPAGTRLFHFLGERPSWLGTADSDDLPGLCGATRFGHPGWDWWASAEEAAKRRADIESHVALLDETLSELLRIEAGVPRWGYELTEDTLPPEAGLDRTHIDYHKGCYIGQEVISRLKSVGHVNRQLTGFVSTTGAPLFPGSALIESEADGRVAGVLTSVAHSFALEKPIALGYLKRGSSTGGLLARPAEAPGADTSVSVCALPFLP